jgi:phosphoglycolate phosphatase
MAFDLYIFDLDGTLIDTRYDLTIAINDMLSRYHLEPKSAEEVTGYVGDGIQKLVERCLGDEGIDVKEAASIFKKSYWIHKLDTTVPYPGVMDLLSRLSGKHKAILTNKSYRFTRAIMDGLRLTPEFSIVVGGDSVRRKKPSTDGVEYILERCGISSERAVLVGDGRNDIVVAKKAGLTAVWAAYGFSNRERILGIDPDYTIDSPIQLLDIEKRIERNS